MPGPVRAGFAHIRPQRNAFARSVNSGIAQDLFHLRPFYQRAGQSVRGVLQLLKAVAKHQSAAQCNTNAFCGIHQQFDLVLTTSF